MKPSPSLSKKSAKSKSLLLIIAIVGIATIVGLIGVGVSLFAPSMQKSKNYAEQVAKPLEEGLIKDGAIKKCSYGDNGRESTNHEPRYYAIYEIPGNREVAAGVVRTAAKETGYTLEAHIPDINREDNTFYKDHTNKKSIYSDLLPGNVELDLTVFGSSTHTERDNQFCTVTKRESPPLDRTTIRFTINLPAFKR